MKQDIKSKIEKKKQELAALEKQLEAIEAQTPEQRLACDLHNLTCMHNHTDSCSWYYEMQNGVDDWAGHAHNKYLGHALQVMTASKRHGVSIEDMIEMYKVVRGQ